MKNALRVIAGAEMVVITVFFMPVIQADQAMEKTGVGDLALWSQWNGMAGKAFLALVVLWLAALLAVGFQAVQAKSLAQFRVSGLSALAVGAPPLFLVVGYVVIF